MEEMVSFFTHIAGAILFCVAIGLLLYIVSVEDTTIQALEDYRVSNTWEFITY